MGLQIGEVRGYEVLDSGNPTVQVEVILLDGAAHGQRAVRGLHRGARALELRDGDARATGAGRCRPWGTSTGRSRRPCRV